MPANTFADYMCLTPETEVTLSSNHEFEFDAHSGTVVNSYSRSPLLMFRVRSSGIVGSLTLRVELNGRQVLGDTQIAVELSPRSFHEIVNRDLINPGARNVIRFSAVGVNDTAEIIISDVVIWYQREV